MHNTLQLKGQFYYAKNKTPNLGVTLATKAVCSKKHLLKLIDDLQNVQNYWKNQTCYVDGIFLSVKYNQCIAKSNRVSKLINPDKICGAKFVNENNITKHVFTYFIKKEELEDAIRWLKQTYYACEEQKLDKIDASIFTELKSKYRATSIAKTRFLQIIKDACFVEEIFVDLVEDSIDKMGIITFYETNKKAQDILKNINLFISNDKIIDERTIQVSKEEFEKIKNNIGYLVSMQVEDFCANVVIENKIPIRLEPITIPEPTNEPYIGVIDTLFSKDVYFSDWVEYEDTFSDDIPKIASDYDHGTAVTSIIVDGPTINPNLDDGCGRFRVKHFGVALSNGTSSFEILKKIEDIVAKHKEIKVWNLSLGSPYEISPNFISPEADLLDKIQSENDVVFVVAGTNKPSNQQIEKMKLGSPADSLNSIVVNSVKKNQEPTSYHRVGPVLSFFQKPDISYYGGDKDEGIKVCLSTGEWQLAGTSFAAPWIARKMAYLIEVMGLNKEIAKALLIDSACKWNTQYDKDFAIGYGVVPVHIKDILQTSDDEIKFVILSQTKEYENYTYQLPVPKENDKYPFYAKVVMCYFPKCCRKGGIDYTNTELELQFGRVNKKKEAITIDNIKNTSTEYLTEKQARDLQRKWDNVKVLSETIKEKAISKKSYGDMDWGIKIVSKERLVSTHKEDLTFGIVVTLKEMNGNNRYDDFVKQCLVKNWLVSEIDIEQQLTFYNKAEEDVIFD